jgi:NADH-quinone oxidoreductase subunit J
MSTFYFIAFLSIFFSILVITAKNPVHSILYLILTFFTFTVHYILLNAQFLAVVNFIVYMGAILVLFLYTLMLINLNKESEPRKIKHGKNCRCFRRRLFFSTILVGCLKSK